MCVSILPLVHEVLYDFLSMCLLKMLGRGKSILNGSKWAMADVKR